MTWMSTGALVAAGLGVLLLILGIVRLCRLRFGNGCGHCVLGAVLIAAGITAGSVGAHLHTYDRLTRERDVLDIRFIQEDEQLYTAIIEYPDSPVVERFRVHGDQWQVDARMLKWRGPGMLAGLDSRYRLERLSGRYADVEQERNDRRSVHELGADEGLNLWSLVRNNSEYLPWVDAVYGSATYLPMRDGARYRVRVTQSGLLARSLDEDTAAVVEAWE